MKKNILIGVLIILIVLTILSAITSNSKITYVTESILMLAVLKFLLVAFYFMELRYANIFWNYLLICCLIIFISLVLII